MTEKQRSRLEEQLPVAKARTTAATKSTQSGKYPRAHTDINKRLNRLIRGGEETSFCAEFQTS